jgi:predicted metal-dependent hydrolase
LFGEACFLIFRPVILGKGKASDQRTISKKTSGSAFSIFDIFNESSIWGLKPVRQKRIAKKITLVHSAKIPLLGHTYQIVFEENRIKGVKQTENQIIVSHPYNRHHMALMIWLKQKSLHFLAAQSKIFADQLGAKIGRITIREVRSRWGSCSHQGNLSYSWRLIFAPQEVAQYVCAHEVSHLKHMNHSKAFWKTVESIDPNYKEQMDWLRVNGRSLFDFD